MTSRIVRRAATVAALSLAALSAPLHAQTSSGTIRGRVTDASTGRPIADATVSRGGCLIESAGTVVNGTLEKRWMRAVANLGLDSPWEEAADEQ